MHHASLHKGLSARSTRRAALRPSEAAAACHWIEIRRVVRIVRELTLDLGLGSTTTAQKIGNVNVVQKSAMCFIKPAPGAHSLALHASHMLTTPHPQSRTLILPHRGWYFFFFFSISYLGTFRMVLFNFCTENSYLGHFQ